MKDNLNKSDNSQNYLKNLIHLILENDLLFPPLDLLKYKFLDEDF